MSEFKNCPFCNSGKISMYMHFHPKCDDCGAFQDKVNGYDAIKAWNARTDEWVSTDCWQKEDCKPVWVYYSLVTDLGFITGQDKAYWCDTNKVWRGFGIGNVFSAGAVARYVMPLPQPPESK